MVPYHSSLNEEPEQSFISFINLSKPAISFGVNVLIILTNKLHCELAQVFNGQSHSWQCASTFFRVLTYLAQLCVVLWVKPFNLQHKIVMETQKKSGHSHISHVLVKNCAVKGKHILIYFKHS